MKKPRMPLSTQNESWGFFGTMGTIAQEAWPLAFTSICEATQADAEATRAFLDSSLGRHFGDDVRNFLHAGNDLGQGIALATACWSAWTIGRADHKRHGIPLGLSYLKGHVINQGLLEESLDAA